MPGFLDPLLTESGTAPARPEEEQLSLGWKYLRHQLCRRLEEGRGLDELFAAAALEVIAAVEVSAPLERRDPTVDVSVERCLPGEVDFQIVEREPSELGWLLGFFDGRVRARCQGRGSSSWSIASFPGLERQAPQPRSRPSQLAVA